MKKLFGLSIMLLALMVGLSGCCTPEDPSATVDVEAGQVWLDVGNNDDPFTTTTLWTYEVLEVREDYALCKISVGYPDMVKKGFTDTTSIRTKLFRLFTLQ